MASRAQGILAAAAIAFAGQANAEACDYTVSKLAGKTVAAVTGSGAGAGLQAAGHYTLAHAGSGLKMLGEGARAEIVSGASGLAGSVGAVLMAPATLVIGGIAIIGIGSFEGYCYFQVNRITDPYEVRKIIESLAENDDAISIVPTDDGDAMALQVQGETKTYLLRKLYIADGQLKHRDWAINTNLGPVAFTAKELPEAGK
jgi:hypothetical protein